MNKTIITCRFTLDSPVVLTLAGGDPNSADTLSYLSGSAVLGALAGAWCRDENKRGNLADDADFFDFFLSGNFFCLNAYPEGQSGKRLLPSPLSFYYSKDNEDYIYDFSSSGHLEDYLEEDGISAWPQKFVCFDDRDIYYCIPKKEIHIHHQRDPDKGRATKNKGAVYSYTSLKAGQRFIGMFLCEEKLAEKVQSLLKENHINIGRSKTAQYGGGISCEIIKNSREDRWTETGSCDGIAKGAICTATLTSDYLGCDERGNCQADTEIWLNEFTAMAGLDTKRVQLADQHIPSFAAMRQVGGYVSTWAMPRPLRPALRAGTTLVFTVNDDVPPDRIQEILWRGLGERRVEGFGRFVLDWCGAKNIRSDGLQATELTDKSLETLSTADGPEDALDVDSKTMLGLCQKRILIETMKKRLPALLQGLELYAIKPKKIPSRSQLDRVRQQIKTADSQEVLQDWFDEIRGHNKLIKKALTTCHIDSLSLLDWLVTLFQRRDSFKEKILWDDLLQKYTLGQGIPKYDLGALLWLCQCQYAEAVLQELILAKKLAERQEEDE